MATKIAKLGPQAGHEYALMPGDYDPSAITAEDLAQDDALRAIDADVAVDALALIDRSVGYTEIVHTEHSLALAGVLGEIADGDVDTGEYHDFWGTRTDGAGWRIQLDRVLDGEDDLDGDDLDGDDLVEGDLVEGDLVEGGAPGTDDHDTGRVIAVDGDQVTVAWDSHTRTTQHRSVLRKVQS